MATTVDQKTYLLNKYLKAPSTDKKKRKRKHLKGTGLRIIDDDVDTSRLRQLEPDELEALGEGGEDAPQVAGIVDERPDHVKKMEQFTSSSKWRVIAQDDGFDSKIHVEEVKKKIAQMDETTNPIFGKMYSDSEDEKKDSDLSPPRKTADQPKTTSHSDKSRNKQIHHNSDSDLSPHRNNSRRKSDSRQSPPRQSDSAKEKESRPSKSQRHCSDSDLSPPRKNESRKPKDRPDQSTRKSELNQAKEKQSKKRRKSSDSDLSPPRNNELQKSKDRPRKASRWGHFGPEVPHKSQESDQSPPRKNRNSGSPGINPKRRIESTLGKHGDSDLSPLRKSRKSSSPRQKRDSDSDLLPPRKTAHGKKRDRSKDSDLSPPRKSREGRVSKNRSPERMKSSSRPDERSGPPKNRTLNFVEERNVRERGNEKREKDTDRIKERYRENKRNGDSPPPSNKKMAKTLEGKTAGLQDARQLRLEGDEFRRREDELFAQMSGDLSGRDATAANRRLGKRESSADREKKREDREKQKVLEEKYSKWGKGLKQVADQQARVEDYVHEASKPLARHRDDADLERTLRSVERAGDPMLDYMRGKKKDSVDVVELPMYKGNWPPNRFNIRPGYRWDGVDRSNGYEAKYFDHRSKDKALAEEAYKWSTEDL